MRPNSVEEAAKRARRPDFWGRLIPVTAPPWLPFRYGWVRTAGSTRFDRGDELSAAGPRQRSGDRD